MIASTVETDKGYDPYNSADRPGCVSALNQSRKNRFLPEKEMPMSELLAMRCTSQELSDALAFQLAARKRI